MKKVCLSVFGTLTLAILFGYPDLPSKIFTFTRAAIITYNALPAEKIAEMCGYKVEMHTVTTPDGYLIDVIRMQNRSVQTTTPVILQHGMFVNAAKWIVLEPGQNLASMLADAGYDIWLTNIRGNNYGRKHQTLKENTPEFWDYGWHENGAIDMPATIDYILNETNQRQLFYIGHSMGTTMFFVMTSLRPEYNDKIKHMFGLAPVVYLGHTRSAFKCLAPSEMPIRELIRTHLNNRLPGSKPMWFKLMLAGYCAVTDDCLNLTGAIFGYPPTENLTMQEILFSYFPDAATAKQLAHYGQAVNNPHTFRLYDYGKEVNKLKYNSSTPPDYPLHNIKVPITLFHSTNDYLSEKEDVELLSKKLKNITLVLLEDPYINHFGFLQSLHARNVIYKSILETLNSYRNL